MKLLYFVSQNGKFREFHIVQFHICKNCNGCPDEEMINSVLGVGVREEEGNRHRCSLGHAALDPPLASTSLQDDSSDVLQA